LNFSFLISLIFTILFCDSKKIFDFIHVDPTVSKDIIAVFYAMVLPVSLVYQVIIRLPFVAVNVESPGASFLIIGNSSAAEQFFSI